MDRPYENIEVLTHCDPTRAFRACLLARSMPSDIPVLCAVNGESEEIARRLAGITVPANLRFFPAPARPVYPANALRNAALAEATSEWVFYIDCDFVFCEDFWPQLLLKYGEFLKSSDPVCLCPVALQDPSGTYLNEEHRARQHAWGEKPSEICREESAETHVPPRNWGETGRAALFKFHDRCFTEPFGDGCQPYDLTRRMRRLRHTVPAEPWGLIRRADMAWADEDFVAGPLDKQQVVSATLDRGVRFIAMADLFIFHLWHPETTGARADRVRNRSLWVKRHASAPFHFLAPGGGESLSRRLGHSLTQSLARVPQAKDASYESHDNVDGCVQAMKRGTRVVFGPAVLSRHFLRYDYRICIFFDSPEVCRKDLAADGDYVFALAHTRDLKEATARLDNVAAVCDEDNPEACLATLRNVTGLALAPCLEEEGKSGTKPGLKDDLLDRQRNPRDYFLYDYLRALAGTC